jgi:hypothetical protein
MNVLVEFRGRLPRAVSIADFGGGSAGTFTAEEFEMNDLTVSSVEIVDMVRGQLYGDVGVVSCANVAFAAEALWLAADAINRAFFTFL